MDNSVVFTAVMPVNATLLSMIFLGERIITLHTLLAWCAGSLRRSF